MLEKLSSKKSDENIKYIYDLEIKLIELLEKNDLDEVCLELLDKTISNQDEVFYKYRQLNKNTLEGLVSNSLYMQKIDQIDDPLDSPFSLLDNNSAFKSLVKFYDKFQPKILSFSKNSIDISMFKNYADNHNGICIGYKINRNSQETFFIKSEVDYKQEIKIVDLLSEDYGRKIFTTKRNDLHSEKEYRFVKLDTKEKTFTSHFEINEIIFGLNCSLKDKVKIIDLLKDKKAQINYYETDFQKEKFAIEKKKISPSVIENIQQDSKEKEIKYLEIRLKLKNYTAETLHCYESYLANSF